MPKGKSKIELLVEAKVREALRDLDKTDKEIDNLSKSGSRATNVFKGWATAAKTLIGALAIREIARFTLEVAKLGDQVNQVSKPFTKLVNAAGKDLTGALRDLRGAVKGTISDLELMQIAATAMDAFTSAGMGATEAFEATQQTMDFLFRYSTKFGKDFSQLMQTVFTGLQRGSALFLDDVGIMISATDKQFEGLDEVAKKAKIVEVALGQMAQKNELLGDVTGGATVEINRAAAAFENFKIIIGAVLTGPVAQALEFINESFAKLGFNIDKILATGIEKQLLETRERIKEIQREMDIVNKNIELNTSGVGKFGAALNRFFGHQPVLDLEHQLAELHNRLIELRKEEFELEKKLQGEKGKEIKKRTGRQEIEEERKIAEAIQNLRLQAAITGAQNEYQEKLIRLDAWYEQEKKKFIQNEEYQAQLKETYEARKSKIREEILVHNEEILQKSLENEILLEIEAAEKSQGIWEQRRQNFTNYAREIGYIFSGPMNQMVADLIKGTREGAHIWSDFVNSLMEDIRRFLADQAVRMFFNLLANAIFPGAGNVFGSIAGNYLYGGGRQFGGPMSPGKLYTVGEAGPEIVYQGKRGGYVMPLPQVNNPSPVSMPAAIYTRIIDRSRQVPIMGNIQLESVAPELNKVRNYYININREINIPDTDHFNQFNRTKKGEFDKD